MSYPRSRRGVAFAICFALLGSVVLAASTTAQDSGIEALRRQMEELMRRNEEQQRQIETLREKLESIEARPAPTTEVPAAPVAEAPASPREELDKALSELEVPPDPAQVARPAADARQPALLARRIGPAELRLMDVSFDALIAAGSSTEGGSSLRQLQGGAHDPNRRGFTFQQGELGLAGAVDPYLTAEAYIIFGTDFVELEEAFFTTTALPYNLQLQGGFFFTRFGRINPLHPHSWHWQDQPVINTRVFGSEGLRSPGFDLRWLAPLPWFSEVSFGMQNADEGDLTLSFLSSDGVGGRPAVDTDVHSLRDLLYFTRWANSWDISDEISALIGVSGLTGANSTGADGQTFVYGTDLTFKWRPARSFRGWPFVIWESEVIKRDYTADWFIAGTQIGGDGGGGNGHDHGGGGGDEDEDEFTQNLPGAILRDWGLYSQLLWGFRHPWAAGLRFEYASGRGQSVMGGELVSRAGDPFRDDRIRVSPLLAYHPTEFSRIRLQYNFDDAKHLAGDDAHSVWLGFEFMYGAHPAHKY